MGDREAVRESPFTQDVDAIGAICFDLLVGASPLRVGNVPLPKLSREIVDRGPRQLIGGSQAVWSEQLESLVYRTLRRDLDHSVRSATEFVAELQTVLTAAESHAGQRQLTAYAWSVAVTSALTASVVMCCFAG